MGGRQHCDLGVEIGSQYQGHAPAFRASAFRASACRSRHWPDVKGGPKHPMNPEQGRELLMCFCARST